MANVEELKLSIRLDDQILASKILGNINLEPRNVCSTSKRFNLDPRNGIVEGGRRTPIVDPLRTLVINYEWHEQMCRIAFHAEKEEIQQTKLGVEFVKLRA
jgi:hypothetical protein